MKFIYKRSRVLFWVKNKLGVLKEKILLKIIKEREITGKRNLLKLHAFYWPNLFHSNAFQGYLARFLSVLHFFYFSFTVNSPIFRLFFLHRLKKVFSFFSLFLFILKWNVYCWIFCYWTLLLSPFLLASVKFPIFPWTLWPQFLAVG